MIELPWSSRLGRGALLVLGTMMLLSGTAGMMSAQGIDELPFAPGERMSFAGQARAGVSGRGTLSVEGPVALRGTSTWVLKSDMEGRFGPLRASDENASWIDPTHMSTLRYTSRERHLLVRRADAVDIFTTEGRWSAESGAKGELATTSPLDELSFLYYLRTLPLAPDTDIKVSRHFDVERNPTNVRVLGREVVEVPAGRFRAIIVEMRVRDARRYQGEGMIRIHLSDDRCRLILRLESQTPDAGKGTLALTSYEGMRGECSARLP